MKFDVVLINPPYEAGHHLYMYFLEKTSQLSENLISINPIGFIFSKTNKGIHKKLKDQINKHKVIIDEIDGNKVFKDASFLGFNLGICEFIDNKNYDKGNATRKSTRYSGYTIVSINGVYQSNHIRNKAERKQNKSHYFLKVL